MILVNTGSCYVLSSVRHQVISLTDAQLISLNTIHSKMSSAKCWQFSLGLGVLSTEFTWAFLWIYEYMNIFTIQYTLCIVGYVTYCWYLMSMYEGTMSAMLHWHTQIKMWYLSSAVLIEIFLMGEFSKRTIIVEIIYIYIIVWPIIGSYCMNLCFVYFTV